MLATQFVANGVAKLSQTLWCVAQDFLGIKETVKNEGKRVHHTSDINDSCWFSVIFSACGATGGVIFYVALE